MGCLTGVVKNVLFIFNFLIVICGITLIAIGGVILAKESQADRFTDYNIGGCGIAVGIIIFCIAFLGCCGAIKENNCMLTTYAVVLIVLLILQVVLASLAFFALKNDDFDDEAEKVVRDIFQKYLADEHNKEKKEVVDNMQQYFECCGINGPTFWPTPPPSCYEDKNTDGTLFKEGCAPALKDAIVYNMKAMAIVCMVFAIVELVGAVVACIVRSRK